MEQCICSTGKNKIMLALLSPAKRLNLKAVSYAVPPTQPLFPEDSLKVIEEIRKYNPHQLMQLMKISESLAELNYERFQNWHLPFTEENAKAAVYTFMGDAYRGLQAASFTEDEMLFAGKHLRILSGLHGILRPMDLIQAYRMEMGRKVSVGKARDLYDFWSDKITAHINEVLSNDNTPVVLNLASKEYFEAVDTAKLKYPVIHFQFKELKDGQYRFFSMYGKYARGLMVRFMIKNKIHNPEELKLFDWEGYAYNEPLSSEHNWVFTRMFPAKK